MDFDHDDVSRVVEDRLSSLPDHLIHKILSCIGTKFVVQTCLLSSRWKLLWTSMPCLNFSYWHFGSLHKFSKFVTHVFSHRNHRVQVSLLKLNFRADDDQVLLIEIAKYAFFHNVQELNVVSWPKNYFTTYPSYLFRCRSLKHFTLASCCIKKQTAWDLPALKTMHLSHIRLKLCGDLFSKCVNLKNLTLQHFRVVGVKVFDIITPRLSNLMLIDGGSLKVINVIAPQLENLTIIDCSVNYLNAPPGLLSLCYMGYPPLQLSKDRFHSLHKVILCLSPPTTTYWPHEEENARKTINMLQKVHSARYLTLNEYIVEIISSFPDLLLASPFSNLICLTIDTYMRNDEYKFKMSNETRNFLFGNSPSATLVMKLPKGLY